MGSTGLDPFHTPLGNHYPQKVDGQKGVEVGAWQGTRTWTFRVGGLSTIWVSVGEGFCCSNY